jgi:ATP-binding cassette subfamily B protein RaxB
MLTGKHKNIPLILQSEMSECGLACLAMILGFYRYHLSLTQLRRQYKITMRGVTLYQLKNIAKDIGFITKVLRLETNQFTSLQLPCVIHWEMNHFMVVHKVSTKYIWVHDPARGSRRLSFEEVDKSFTGIVLELKPLEALNQVSKPKSQSAKMANRLIKKYGFAILGLVSISCLIQFLYITGVTFVQKIIDSSANSASETLLYLLLVALFGIKIIEFCTVSIRSIMVTSLGTLINHGFGIAVMTHLISLPITFFENRHSGDMMSRFGSVDKIRNTLTEGMVEGLVDGIVSVIVLVFMFLLNPLIASVILIFAFLYFLSRFHYHSKSRQKHEEALHTKAAEISHFMETIRAIPSIKIYVKESDRLREWSIKFISSLNVIAQIAWHKIFYDSVKNLLFAIEFTITLALSCLLMANHKITLGVLYAFLSYRLQFTTAISNLVDKIQDFKLLGLHLDRLDDIVSEPKELPDSNIACFNCVSKPTANLILSNICFAYSQYEELILNNININIKSGECIAITGPSGCGKTTLLKIMMGLLRPDVGNIQINNKLIYPNHIYCYRKIISAVLQNDILFSGTIMDNISFFDPLVDINHVNKCASLAGIIDEIHSLTMGFNTLIGDMGSMLSGGQKQRILLARALYANPIILFLDEATSHLDSKKEREINLSMRSLGITLVMIAHRKETILMADRVFTLENALKSKR